MSFDRDLRAKMASKHDPEMEREAVEWMSHVLNEDLQHGDFAGLLKDGSVLCRLVDQIEPGKIRWKKSAMPFIQMENIAAFLGYCREIGVPPHDTFQTIDLYERKNIPQVATTIHSFSRFANRRDPSIPGLGPKLAQSRSVEFTEQQMRDAKNQVNTFQYGRFRSSSPQH